MSEPTTNLDECLRPSSWTGSEADPLRFADLRSRKRRLLAEQRSRWERGDPAPPAGFLPRWPTDPEADPAVASLLYEDLRQRRLHGKRASEADYAGRFPTHAHALEQLISQQKLLPSTGGPRDEAARAWRRPLVGEEVL